MHNIQETSIIAYQALRDGSAIKEVCEYVREQGFDGATCEEICIALNMKDKSVSPHLYFLRKRNLLYRDGKTRKTTAGYPAYIHYWSELDV
jgi:transcription initiation factor IIE alpha subunit